MKTNTYMKSILLKIGSLFVISTLLACGRPDAPTSQVNISIPQKLFSPHAKLNTLDADLTISHLVINVSGAGISQPILLSYDAHDGRVIPDTVSLDIPTGADRLIQVLGVYRRISTSGMSFYYGDVTKTLSAATETADVSLASISTGAITSGQAIGRYQNADGSFPSGIVNIKYYPQGKPSLLIEKGAMQSGWFRLFILDGAEVGYELPAGQVPFANNLLWGKTMSMSSTEFTPATNVLRAAIPLSYRNTAWSGPSTWEAEQPESFVYGFFGHSGYTTGKCVQAPPSLATLSRLTVYTSTAPANGSSPAAMPGTVESGAFPTAAQLANAVSPWSHYSVKGGSVSACSGTAFADNFSLTMLSGIINGGGKDGASNIQPPLKAILSNGYFTPFMITQNFTPTPGYTFSGEFLPGVRPGVVDGMKVYKRVAATDFEWHSDGAPCLEASRSEKGFAEATGTTFTMTTGEQFDLFVPLTNTEVTTGTYLAACFSKNSILTGSGVLIRKDHFSSGPSPALITMSGADPTVFPNTTVSAQADIAITLTNTGAQVATAIGGSGLAAPFTFKDGVFPGTGGTCSTTILAGANCTVVLTYAPVGVGSHTDTLDISYHNGMSPQTVSRNLSGISNSVATLVVGGGTLYTFPSVAANAIAHTMITIQNTGGTAASGLAEIGLAAPFGFNGGSFPGTAATCTTTLAAGASCTIAVKFYPVSPGTFNDTIEFSYNNGAGMVTAIKALDGTATAAAVLSINNGPTYDFGTIANGGITYHTFTVTNTGGTNATTISGSGLAAPFTYKGGVFPGTGGNCGATIAPAASCTFVVQYAPTANSVHNDTIEIFYNDGVAMTPSSRNVQGTGASPAMLSISDGPTYDFGMATANSPPGPTKTFTVTNSGNVMALSMNGNPFGSHFEYDGGGSFPGTGGTCGPALAPGANCTVVVRFSPTATGSLMNSLMITYNDGAVNTNTSIGLQGTGN